eukprot:UN08883
MFFILFLWTMFLEMTRFTTNMTHFTITFKCPVIFFCFYRMRHLNVWYKLWFGCKME